jgi:FkbM family methyltransferase
MTSNKESSLVRTVLPNGLEVVHINEHETKFLFDEIYTQETYLKHIPALAAEATVVDVGANIGLFTAFFADRHPDAKFVCFEPAPHCLSALRANLARFGDRVALVDMGLGEREETRTFTYYPNYSIMSSFFAEAARDKSLLKRAAQQQLKQRGLETVEDSMLEMLVGSKVEAAQAFDCKLTSLARYAEKSGMTRIDLLKIDVERAELAVLNGVGDALWPHVRSAIVEVHDEGGGELAVVQSMFEKHGFRTVIEEEEKLLQSGVFVIFAWRAAPGEAASRD